MALLLLESVAIYNDVLGGTYFFPMTFLEKEISFSNKIINNNHSEGCACLYDARFFARLVDSPQSKYHERYPALFGSCVSKSFRWRCLYLSLLILSPCCVKSSADASPKSVCVPSLKVALHFFSFLGDASRCITLCGRFYRCGWYSN